MMSLHIEKSFVCVMSINFLITLVYLSESWPITCIHQDDEFPYLLSLSESEAADVLLDRAWQEDRARGESSSSSAAWDPYM